ncbi:MAG: archaea-specific SMC-related protein [Haloglomus sp.]
MSHGIEIRNVGGIRSGEATLDPGLNVVRGENWQGKSSFLTALQVVMGTTGVDEGEHPLTDGSSEGVVTLQTPQGTYETRLVREGTTVRREGSVYLTDEQDRICARLFAFLGENNPVREAVRNDGDLAARLTRPLDIEDIDEKIGELKTERRSVEAEHERAAEASERLPALQSEVEQLTQEIEDLEQRRDELRPDEGGDSEAHSRLSEKRAQREQLTDQIATLENKLERLESRLEERRTELDAIDIPDAPALSADLEEKQSRIAELETDIALLEDLYRVNKRVVDEGKADIVTDVEHTLAGDELECWVCGNSTDAEQVTERLRGIDDQLQTRKAEKRTLESEVEDIQRRRDEIEQRKRQKRDLEAEISELELDLEENRSMHDDLQERLQAVESELESLRDEADSTNSQLTDVESEIKYKRNELQDKQEELDQIETEADRREQLEAELEELDAEIERLQTRRTEKKREVATQFEERMADIIDTFEPGFETARLVPKTDSQGRITAYDLTVARDGRETSRQALSEGELELLGIITAIAGYETFGVSDRVPMILLDGLTALSSANLHSLVEYLRDEAELLVATATPEVGDFDGSVVDPRQWEVVSTRQSSAR